MRQLIALMLFLLPFATETAAEALVSLRFDARESIKRAYVGSYRRPEPEKAITLHTEVKLWSKPERLRCYTSKNQPATICERTTK